MLSVLSPLLNNRVIIIRQARPESLEQAERAGSLLDVLQQVVGDVCDCAVFDLGAVEMRSDEFSRVRLGEIEDGALDRWSLHSSMHVTEGGVVGIMVARVGIGEAGGYELTRRRMHSTAEGFELAGLLLCISMRRAIAMETGCSHLQRTRPRAQSPSGCSPAGEAKCFVRGDLS